MSLAVVVALALPVSAALIPADSSTFANKYDGNDINDGVTDPGNVGDWEIAGGLIASDLSLVSGDDLKIAQTTNNGWL